MAEVSMGARIKMAREAKGFSASHLSRLVGVTPTCVWNWERDNTRPRPSALRAICQAVDVNESHLLVGDSRSSDVDTVSLRKLDDVLNEASSELAELLGIARERVKVRFEILSET